MTRVGVDRVALLRALPGVGDLLCAVPALRAVRARFPDASVTLLGLATAGWFVERFAHLVDDLLVVEGVAGLPEITPDPVAEQRFRRRAAGARFDLALQLHGNGVVTNDLLRGIGARRTMAPGPPLPGPDHRPEILRLLAVVEAAGCPPQGTGLELPVTPAERAAADGLAPAPPFACLHVGASVDERAWSVDGFAAVADHLVARGLRLVLTGTPGDAPRVRAVAERAAVPVVDLVGRTGIGELGALYRQATLVVSNDTGAAHVAAAVRAPSVVVTASPEPDRWAPLDRDLHRTVTATGAAWPDAVWPDAGAVLAAVDDRLALRRREAVR
jgi:ADP-heptose:LPS heptosyltransferase